MLFSLNNQKYAISWGYDNVRIDAFKRGFREKYLCKRTICRIKNLDTKSEIADCATCSTKDYFDKQQGRTLSFLKVVEGLIRAQTSEVKDDFKKEAARSVRKEIFDQLRKDPDFSKILGLR